MSALASLPFIRALQQQNARVYTVGGTVRDELDERPSKDIDLLVTGLPQQRLIRLLQRYGRVQLTGRAFGVIKFFPRQWNTQPIDIALPRTEVSTGVGHRDFDVTFDHTLPIETDLGRRDFTINALAIDLATGELIDPFGGQQDLQQRRLRQVSDRAFLEDPLRMLRGVQLAARYHLGVEATTRHAMQAHAAAITTVAPERIAEELRKLFQARSPASGFILMQDVGLLQYVIPEVAALVDTQETPDDAFTRTMRRLDTVQQCETLAYRGHLDLLLAALLQNVGLPEVTPITVPPSSTTQMRAAHQARLRLETLKMTMLGARLDLIETLIRQSDFALDLLASAAALRHFASRLGVEVVLMLLDLRLADRLANAPEQPVTAIIALGQQLHRDIDHHVPFSVKELAINGHDVHRLGIPPGPRLGQILQRLLHQVLDDPSLNTRAHLLALARQETGEA